MLLRAIACVALLLSAAPSLHAQDPGCQATTAAFNDVVRRSFQASKGIEQQQAASVAVDAVNSCAENPAVLAALFEQADKLNNPQAIVALASILNVAKTPWNVGDAAKQEAWKKKFYEAYKTARDDAAKVALNGALMNADGLYREAVAKMPVAKPGTPEFDVVREGLENTLQFPESPNHDDAKFLLAELKIRQLIAVRMGALSGPNAAAVLAEARKHLTDLIETPRSKPPKYTMYGYWNLALLHLLAGENKQAEPRLDRMRDVYNDSLNDPNKLTWNHTLYYYRAFHYSEFPVINNHITADELYSRWKEASAKWPAGAVFTGADGPPKLAAEMEKIFKDSSTYFISVGVFGTREAAQRRQKELSSSGIDGLMVYPPWPERNVYTVGTGLMTVAKARLFYAKSGDKLPKGSTITRFY